MQKANRLARALTKGRIARLGGVVSALALMQGTAFAQAPEDAIQATDATNATSAQAADAGEPEDQEIIITATKREGETVQNAPLAITAFGAAQLERANFSSLANLDNTVPNAQIGTSSSIPGNANLAIRGLGTNTNIASAEPTVGVFYDGIYLGTFFGNLTNNFDLDSIEVLRGPQGILFGKNVTGGAVVLNSSRPRDELYVDLFASLETGPEYTASAVVSAPIIQDVLGFKIAGYYNNDEGWFYDSQQQQELGGQRTWIVRAALEFDPTENVNILARYEHGDNEGNTDSASQSLAAVLAGTLPNDFYITTSGLGYNYATWDQVTVEANIGVGFGNGRITNIAGWRWVDAEGSWDIDALPAILYQGTSGTRQDQFSNELRYSGTFGPFEVVAGLYYFTQYFQYAEQRRFAASTQSYGGRQWQDTYGIFASLDWHVTDTITLNLGGRYTIEKKEVDVASISTTACNVASVHTSTLQCNFNFSDENTTRGFTPRIGLQWEPDRRTQLYMYWAKGLRGGGYSFRNTNPLAAPGPYRDEIQYAVEAGIKIDLPGGNRVNAAVFRSVVQDLQRDRIFIDPLIGNVSVTGNVGDAVYQGVEVEATLRLTPQLRLSGFVGILDAHYTSLQEDLNRDGVINQTDLNLKIVRAVPLTYGANLTYENRIPSVGNFLARLQYGYTDRQAYLDNNTAFLVSRKVLDGSLALTTVGDHLTISLYGRNLLNQRMTAASVPLGAAFGGGYETLMEGRVFGASVRYRF